MTARTNTAHTKTANLKTEQSRRTALRSNVTPLYAVAGLTDVVAASVRTYEAELKSRASALNGHVKALPTQVRALPDASRRRIDSARQQAEILRLEATSAYGDLAGRGKRVVDEALRTAAKLSETAERRVDVVRAEVTEAIDPAFERLQEGVTLARRRVTGRSATDAMTPRTAVKAASGRATKAKASAVKTSAATKPTAVKATSPATKPTPTGPSAAKKSAARPSVGYRNSRSSSRASTSLT